METLINKRFRLPTFLLGLGLALSVVHSAAGREPLYGALDHPGLLECEELQWSGRLQAARSCYSTLLSGSRPPEIRAEAAWALEDVKTANSLFQTAVERSPENAAIRLRWGELFMQTYQYQEALTLFEEALNIDPGNAYAHIGAAAALREGSGGEGVNQHMAAVMENDATPPGARLRGYLMMIHSSLEQERHERASDSLEEAWELAEEENLLTLKLHALEAALAFLTGEDYMPHVEAALEKNPTYGDAWFIPGYFASITRRYEQAGEFYQKAVDVQPNHWEAHLELGQNHLRLNRVSPAIEHVEISYEGDPFNPKAVNTLRLLDTFTSDFEVVTYPDPPEDGIPELMLRLDKDEKDILKHYARELAEESIATFSERYNFEPREPVVIEIYPNHEDFVVRSLGMPGVGILGVTFGYLFAMDSPSGHPEESYHWGTTLWHEMAHVFTLKITDHEVPRWFSEGISVFEEWRTGPIPGIRVPTDVLRAMADGRFLPVSELDDGFMRPSYNGQVMVSYMQSGLIFEFIDTEYGFDKIVDMLYQFEDGASADEAIQDVLSITIKDFDRHFKQFIDVQYGQLLSQLDTWIEDYRSSFEALRKENWEEAVASAERAIFLYPNYVEPDSPYLAMARAHAQMGEEEKEFEALETFWQKGGYAPRALMALADAYLEKDRKAEAAEVLTDLNYSDPFNQELHVKLGDVLMDLERPREALREYQVHLAMEPLDKASAYYRIARAYRALDNFDASMEHLMTALDIAPRYRPAQRMLLEMTRQDN